MTDATSAEPKQTSQTESEKFPEIVEWRCALAKGDHISKYLNVILETVLSTLPPQNLESPTLRANITGALVDGRLQVWQILGKVKDTGQWRPVGYGTTSIRPDELSGQKSLLIYTLFSYAVIKDEAYQDFWKVIEAYGKDQGCVKVVLFTDNVRVLQMAESVGMETKWHMVTKTLE